jgi:hypothetical protein
MSSAGDPLSGPSAVDAVAAGVVFINPQYSSPKEEFFHSQHPFLQAAVGAPYVCSVDIAKHDQVIACATEAAAADLPPIIPEPLQPSVYLQRLHDILAPALSSTG